MILKQIFKTHHFKEQSAIESDNVRTLKLGMITKMLL